MTATYDFFAPCPRGTESLLGEELKRQRCRAVRPLTSGVSFSGRLESGYRALLWSRVASRVLITLARVPADSADALYEAVRAMPWEDHVSPDGTIAVDATGLNEALRNTQFTAVRVKDAIADRFTEKFGRRPSVNTAEPDLLINVLVRATKAVVSIDIAGPPLHQRGYREPGVQVEAPMKENLAAAVLAVAGWREIAEAGGAFADPMCGSGTLAIEAAMVAGDIAPGLTRRRWGFAGWLGHDAELWARLVDEAADRREAGLAKLPPILASDDDTRAITAAKSSIRRAGLAGYITLEHRELTDFEPPRDADGERIASGLVATNPPYGERITARHGLAALYGDLGFALREGFEGWTFAVITPDDSISEGLKLAPVKQVGLYNGRILSPVRVYHVGPAGAPTVAGSGAAIVGWSSPGALDASRPTPAAESPSTAVPEPATPESQEADVPQLSAAAEAFANRLRKTSKHMEKWTRKAGITCFRVYDADLPDYNVAVDIYHGTGANEGARWVHIAEYAPPGDVDLSRAAARLDDVLEIVPGVLGVDASDVFLKVRERQRGTSQYGRVSRKSVVGLVGEAGLTFEVNFSDYLDTGLFLDHRITRGMLRDMASGTRFLNLFAYTGSGTVYAAAGGATSTTTVDMSVTYTEWAGRNMAANGFTGPRHELVQADVLTWLSDAICHHVHYDLIFCDPPTFSNSKRMMDTWDVQRDHAALIARIGRVLAPQGPLVFSCNRRKFALDTAALAEAGLTARDITASTIPRDFERHTGVHYCYLITRAASAAPADQ